MISSGPEFPIFCPNPAKFPKPLGADVVVDPVIPSKIPLASSESFTSSSFGIGAEFAQVIKIKTKKNFDIFTLAMALNLNSVTEFEIYN